MKLFLAFLLSVVSLQADTTSGNKIFALEIFENLNQGQNLVFSPLSISTCLAMCATGAANDTWMQMQKVLHFPAKASEMNKGFKTLLNQLLDQKSKVILTMAQGLWMNKGARFNPLYQEEVVEDFKGELRQADFTKASQKALLDINNWVYTKTAGKIRNLFKRGQITNMTQLVLVSAIYMKAPFLHPFDSSHTREAPFYVTKERKVPVDMMYQKHNYPLFKGEKVSAIEIPYDGDVVLWIILADKRWDYDEINEGLKMTYVELHLPKFEIHTDLPLIPTLKKMGLTIPFSPQANFSLITNQKISIDQVQHQAYVALDEQGTIAAAATGTGMMTVSLPPDEVIPFVVDRPFDFLIFDKKTDSILFMGHVQEPYAFKG